MFNYDSWLEEPYHRKTAEEIEEEERAEEDYVDRMISAHKNGDW